jgi:3-oxoacyl-[acyl-carrier protein] reductase
MDTPARTKHAVVTGTGSGIGAAIARRLLDEGWYVTGLDRSVGSISAPVFNGVVIDLTDFDGVSSLLREMSGVHAFVHAAGYMRVAPLGEVRPQDGEGMWRIHVQAAVVIANALIPKFSPQGRIVLIGSRTAFGAAGRSQYSASKAALVGLARSWASELAPRGITVNIVAPGATDTPMLQDPSRSGAQPRMPPIGRFIRPEEVAALTSFLLTDDAGAITGQQIVICGGGSL